MNLFAYGTLMDPEIMAQVSGVAPRSENATLAGYVRKAVRGEVFPAVIARTGASVDGVVYFGLPPEAFARLDRFEGELYRRISVAVVGKNGDPVTAEAYVIAPEFADRLSERDWRFDRFRKSAKERFQRSYRGYDDL